MNRWRLRRVKPGEYQVVEDDLIHKSKVIGSVLRYNFPGIGRGWRLELGDPSVPETWSVEYVRKLDDVRVLLGKR